MELVHIFWRNQHLEHQESGHLRVCTAIEIHIRLFESQTNRRQDLEIVRNQPVLNILALLA